MLQDFRRTLSVKYLKYTSL